jgi:hypothetical protein
MSKLDLPHGRSTTTNANPLVGEACQPRHWSREVSKPGRLAVASLWAPTPQ